MKAVILAAGQGTRLRPLTDDRPKCMVEYKGKPIINYILDILCAAEIDNIAVVGGYKMNVLKKHLSGYELQWYENRDYEKTNMVSSFFCARDFFDDDIVLSYSDIMYSGEIIEALLRDNSDFSVVVDKKWRELWQKRMENPLLDAETMKIDAKGYITELGKKPTSYDAIGGQYIGLVKISKDAIKKLVTLYDSLDKDAIYDGKSYQNMYMTSFIQMVIDCMMPAKAVFVEGGWIEIDTSSDLKLSAVI